MQRSSRRPSTGGRRRGGGCAGRTQTARRPARTPAPGTAGRPRGCGLRARRPASRGRRLTVGPRRTLSCTAAALAAAPSAARAAECTGETSEAPAHHRDHGRPDQEHGHVRGEREEAGHALLLLALEQLLVALELNRLA